MKPTYYPFTWISKENADAFASCFGQISVYVPSKPKVPESMKKLAENGLIDLRCPVIGDDDRLDTMIKQYKSWLEIHQGSDLSVFLTSNNEVPFYDESSIANIRAELKQELKPAKKKEKKIDHLFHARLFLQLAQNFDQEHAELDLNYESVSRLEEMFLKELKGEEDLVDFKPVDPFVPENPENYMIPQRLNAWAQLMIRDVDRSGIFVTSSKSVLETTLEFYPVAIQLYEFHSIPIRDKSDSENQAWQNELMNALIQTVNSPWNSSNQPVINPPASYGSEKYFDLYLYVMPNISPFQFFKVMVKPDEIDLDNNNHQPELLNTVFGIIDQKIS